jgi:hypothetical protein
MEYRFVIHLSEDLAQHEEAVRKILAFNDDFKGTDDEYLSLCEKWFSFRRFEHPGEAIEYYEREKVYPDLKIQDIDFTELKNKKNVPEQFRKNISGIFEIEFVLRTLEKEGINRRCLFIPYSGKLEDELIIQALHETEWLDKTVKKILEVVGGRILKDKQSHLKLKIKESLKELARSYFEKLEDKERSRIKNIAIAYGHANWKDFTVKFETFDFQLNNMLIGFGNTEEMSPKEISDIVIRLLTESQLAIEFNGQKWNSPGECFKTLEEYLNDADEYQGSKREITLRSIDVLMDLMKINNQYGFSSNEELSLFGRNKLYKIGTHSRKYDWYRIFKDKLVGRRVTIALSTLYDLNSETLLNICELISKGKTDYKIITNTKGGSSSRGESPDERSFVTNTITKDLGLFRDSNKIVVADKKILREEMTFLQTYVANGTAACLRYFLDNFPTRLSYTNGFGLKKPDYFLDLTDFNDFLFAFQKKAPAQMRTVISDVNSFIQFQEKSKEVKRILALMNPLFL